MNEDWNGRVAVNLEDDVKQKFLEIKDYLRRHFAVQRNAGVIRFVILEFHKIHNLPEKTIEKKEFTA